jgi:metallo-beta-lactamase family protein
MCDFFQGKREESYQRNQNFRIIPAQIDAVIHSHAHIDHSGKFAKPGETWVRSSLSIQHRYSSPCKHHAALISGHIKEFRLEYVKEKS